jgi:hypothetical protein|tara:strand:+ start:432 stop:563 length:132 start_codon:yes stop_codon:yes gene_type:complete
MGKKPDPTDEELEYVYAQIARGLADREIMDEMMDREFPLRMCT